MSQPESRTNQIVALMRDAIDSAIESGGTAELPALDEAEASLLMDLSSGLAGREGAFVLLAFSIFEGRVLNLVDQAAGDLKADTPRLHLDRAVSEALSKNVLDPRGIPATRGALQSSTYRGGYLSPQANKPALARFVRWASEPERDLSDLKALFAHLAAVLASESFVVPDLPELDRAAFAFPAFAQLISLLLSVHSQGAFQQYLFAALLSEYVEVTILDRRLRVVTKPIFQSDKSAGTAGDVEIRAGQNLEAVFEVSANNWRTKLPQAVQSLASRDELTSITILAADVPTSGSELASELAAVPLPLGLDPRRIDLIVLGVDAECLSLAGKLSPRERMNVVHKLYEYLVSYCRNLPDLVAALIDALTVLDLAEPESLPN